MAAGREGTWNRAARRYARQERLECQAIRRALKLAAPRPEEELLDVATGTGLVLRELALRPGPPARAVGLDRSEAMLARVGALPAGWCLVPGDATALPFPDASFDVALCAYLLHVLEPEASDAALAELRRVVRPGGRLVVVTVWTARTASSMLLAGLARVAPEAFIGLRPLDPRPALTRAGWTPARAAVLREGYPSLIVLARRG